MDYTGLSNEELERLVSNRDGEAICEMGERCLHGTRGHEVNLTRAYQLFHKGEKMGLSKAYIGLGEMYRNGIYFMRNEELARDYYQKAGVPFPTGTTSGNVSPGTTPSGNASYSTMNHVQSGMNQSGITSASIQGKLQQAEALRAADNYMQAKNLCNEVIRSIEGVHSGFIIYTGTDDVDDFLIEAYWTMAYIAFNEQRYQEMETYLAKEGVHGLHPWGAYLAAISHRITQAPDIILEQDLQLLTTVSNNQNLSRQERGDVCAMIADLLQEGYGRNSGATPAMARNYYIEAANCGNTYAEERLKNM